MNARSFCLCVAALVAAPSVAAAQIDPDSVHHRNRCRFAVQTITTGHPEPWMDRAWTYIERCPADARVQATVAALQRIRGSDDLDAIRPPVNSVVWLRDGRLLDAVLALAADESASVPARVVAFMALQRVKDAYAFTAYENFTSGTEVGELLVARCSLRSSEAIAAAEGPVGFPPDYVRLIECTARRIARDRTQPRDVRTAAACVG